MSWVSSYIKSSVGAKHIMAITGLILSLWILAHMLGNLLLFAGPEALNAYAVSLKEAGAGGLVWLVRIAVLGAVVAHIAAGLRLAALNRAARPVKYAVFKPIQSPFYARSMVWTGLLVLAFVVYHLLHFTFGVVQPDHFAGQTTPPDVYSMVVRSFQVPAVAISYIVAMALLSMHLAHGVSSLFQSLGINHPKYNNTMRYAGPVYAGIIFAGNTAMPLFILLGVVKLPGA